MSGTVPLLLLSYGMSAVGLITLAVLRRAAGHPALPFPQWWLRVPAALRWAAYAAIVVLLLKVTWTIAIVEAGEYGNEPSVLRVVIGILDVAAWATLIAAGITAWRRNSDLATGGDGGQSPNDRHSVVAKPSPSAAPRPANDELQIVDRPRPGLIVLVVFPAFGLTFGISWLVWSQFDSVSLPLLLTVQGVALLLGSGIMLWNYINVDYVVSSSALLLRQGGRRRQLPLSEIVCVEYGRGFGEFPIESYANRIFRRLVIHVTEGPRVVITPTNPEEMRDEILRGRDSAR